MQPGYDHRGTFHKGGSNIPPGTQTGQDPRNVDAAKEARPSWVRRLVARLRTPR